MPHRIETFWHRIRNFFNRSRLLVKILRLDKCYQKPFLKGLVLIQIDALPKEQLQKAISSNEMPFIKNLLNKQQYKLHTHYSGMPCSTPDVQAELFYGVKSAVPAFSFYDHKLKRILAMFNPPDAYEVEKNLQLKNKGLLTCGSCYSDIFTGQADEAHFTISALALDNFFKNKHPVGYLLMMLLNLYSLIRTFVLLIVEFFLAVIDFFKGIITKHDFWKELKFVPSRVGTCVLMRELIVIGANIDIARSMPVIHINLMGYHEQSHRRGPTSLFAHWTLRGIDDAVKRIWLAAHRSTARQYEVWLYSDHGQIETTPYYTKFGKTIQQAISEIFDNLKFSSEITKKNVGFLARAGLRKPNFFSKIFPPSTDHPDTPMIAALGPVGHLYLKNKLPSKDMELFISNLINHAHVPMVLMPDKINKLSKIDLWTKDGHFLLPDDADQIFSCKLVFFNEMLDDLIDACHKENCGDLLLSGWDHKNNSSFSFAIENGSHGGLSPDECHAFAMLPRQTLIDSHKGYLRPLDIRSAAQALLEGYFQTNLKIKSEDNTLKIMTYNVHGCVGVDGKLSPHRIAEVIWQYQPDIIALQELDVRRLRSAKQDQALIIAEHLKMDHQFFPTMQLAEEAFGDAIISSFPLRLMKKASLARLKAFASLEPRGVIWVQIDFQGKPLNIFNTHLGLNSQERLIHSVELLSDSWIKHQQCSGPVILCGDFNSPPGSKVFRLFDDNLKSVQKKNGRHKPTWFGRYPLFCIDHIFTTPDFKVLSVEVCDSYLARIASDHRPIITHLKLLN